MTDPDPNPVPGSPEFRRWHDVTRPNIRAFSLAPEEPAWIPPQPGSPSGVAIDSKPITKEIQQALDEQEERDSLDSQNTVRGQIVVPEMRLPKCLGSASFLLGVVAILSIVGLFIFAQSITVLSQITVLDTTPRWICYALLILLLSGIVIGAGRLLFAYFRLTRTQKVTLKGIEALNKRAQFRKIASEEGDKAFEIVRAYLDEFPSELAQLIALGFTHGQAERLISSRRDLMNPAKDGGSHDWLQRFRQDFQSVVDDAAKACIKRRARSVGLKVAALPIPFMETAIVLHGAFSMIADLCQIYRLRLGATETLIVTGWAAIQGLIAGRLDDLTGNEADKWEHDFQDHLGGSEAVASAAHDSGADTVKDAASMATHAVGDFHFPLAGRILKRGAKGFLQYMLLRRLGKLTQRWLRMVD